MALSLWDRGGIGGGDKGSLCLFFEYGPGTDFATSMYGVVDLFNSLRKQGLCFYVDFDISRGFWGLGDRYTPDCA